VGIWNSSPHPISDIRDWRDLGRLELKPDFQRREVWSNAAKVMLMDTILRKIPMPKIFLSAVIRENRTYRIVIDGQQRIRAILDFLDNQYKLQPPYVGEHEGLTFAELPQETQEEFLQYSIDFNEAINSSDDELREIYSRVNKYTIALTKQELRRADFPGAFLDLSEELALDDYLDTSHIFTTANRRRLGDVEYISELLAGLLDGPQEKKQTLDTFYQNYSSWPAKNVLEIRNRFIKVIENLQIIFSEDSFSISQTRFRKKADFYSIFLAIDSFLQEGHSLEGKELIWLREDLKMLEYNIEPNSHVKALSEYAIRCVSDANSGSSRSWRTLFLSNFLAGTYLAKPPSIDVGQLYSEIDEDLRWGQGMCPDGVNECYICELEIEGKFSKDFIIIWPEDSSVFQLSNAGWVHVNCLTREENKLRKLTNDRQIILPGHL